MSNAVVKSKQSNLISFLTDPKFANQLKAVLPSFMTPEKMVRIAITEIRMNPKLAECDPLSFAGAIMRCAQIGLEPSSESKHIHLIPFKNNKMNRTECQLIVGYRGYITKAARSNIYIECDVVKKNDDFEFEKGIDTKCKFRPLLEGDRGDVKGAYALARICLPDKTIIYSPEYMNKNDIDAIKKRSKSFNKPDSPWHTDYDAMARKTPIRKLINYIPIDSDLAELAAIDDAGEDFAQDNASLIDGAELINAQPENIQPVKSQAEALADAFEEAERQNETKQ